MAENIEVVNVTPRMAAEWLLRNTHNRSVRQRVVLAYAADMAAGNWRWNGESIKFGLDGTLLDGQHRLEAVVESDVTLPLAVVRGLPNETQETVDGGAKRKFSDVLKLRGERAHATLAAVTRRVTIWEWGIRKTGTNAYAPTNTQMLQTLEKYPELREIAIASSTTAAKCGLPASIIGHGWWLFSRVSEDPKDVEFFFDRLGDGQGLVKGDPIYELRRAADNSRSVRGERSQTYLMAILIKAWNAYRAGETIGLLRYKPGGERPEKFPEPE